MTTYDTGNPVPSGDARDRFDNTQTLDELINSPLSTARSRLGVPLKTWAGIQQQVTAYLIAQGYESVYLVYGAGVVVQRQTQLVQRSGELYRVMNAASIPLTLTGDWATDAPKLQAVGDAALRPIVNSILGAIKKSGKFNSFAQSAASNILFIGDSNGSGAGSGAGYFPEPGQYNFTDGYIARVARSLLNAFDKYPGSNRGYMYYGWLNAYQQLLSEPGWTGADLGTPVGGGPAGNAWRMPAGEWIERTGIEATNCKIFFAPSTDGSTYQVTVNGNIATVPTPVNADGLSDNIVLLAGGAYIKPTDKVRLTCVSGSIDLYGMRFLRGPASYGPIVLCSPEGSQSFSDYTEPNRSALLARYMTADQPGPNLICCFLGTNNMIDAASKQKTPAEMVSDMLAFLGRWRTLVPECTILFWTPPRPGPTANLPLAPYEDYVSAIIGFVEGQTNVGLIRMDMSGVEGAEFYAVPDPVPGAHLNRNAHGATAKFICDYFGISVDTALPGFAEYPQTGSNANGTYTRTSDGRMRCAYSNPEYAVSIADGATHISPVFPFPAPFSATPDKLYSGYVTNGGGGALGLSVTAGASGNTGWQFIIKNNSGAAVTRVLELAMTAEGTY